MTKPPRISDIRTTVNSHITFENRAEGFGMNSFDITNSIEDFVVLSNDGAVKTGPPLKTDFFILILCLQGESQKTLGPFSLDVRPRTIHLVSPRYISSYRDKTDDLKLYMLLFKPEFLTESFIKKELIEQLLDTGPDQPPIFELDEDSFRQFRSLFEQIDREVKQKKNFSRQVIRLLLIQILFEMNRACETCSSNTLRQTSRQHAIVFNFRKHVDEHFLEKRTVREYADLISISPKYLLEVVKNETGQTALQIIHNRLYLEAQYLLNLSGKSIKEVAMELGFATSSHFSRFFRQMSSRSPLEYQQQR
ncbi:AraC family transcriptional regulator [Mucilaginibacter conchicola]|uniref:AraC family transcriptional regulator n=1 Tax=Mucilaginibacter conchicola TaxID=2303333 RepID=A0A372NR79_9SPHI|nr:helix-turn-helix domain-containing protein [Mucilaginibacter conchicola]RFZ91140.1 AraC family transcriptional regulator [Mucilaginibacter conchicola]